VRQRSVAAFVERRRARLRVIEEWTLADLRGRALAPTRATIRSVAPVLGPEPSSLGSAVATLGSAPSMLGSAPSLVGSVVAILGLPAAIIESAGFSVAKRPIRRKPAFAARYGGVQGRAVLDVRAVGSKAVYYWQMSSNGTVWTDLTETVVSTTSVTGLTPVTLYYFRFCTRTRAGLSEWSSAIDYIAR
jgi:hypothetical protein